MITKIKNRGPDLRPWVELRVELVRRYSNRADLQEGLSSVAVRASGREAHDREALRVLAADDPPPRVWRLRDRLGDESVQELIEGFRAGATARALADKFKISKSSVKTLLREHGVSRRNQG